MKTVVLLNIFVEIVIFLSWHFDEQNPLLQIIPYFFFRKFTIVIQLCIFNISQVQFRLSEVDVKY